MSAERVHDVFAEALAHRAETVDAFLEAACRDEPEVEAEVRSLLAARRRAGAFLEKPLAERVRVAEWAEPVSFAPGDMLDDYEILDRLGAGGAGVVYEALARDPERKVAIKVLNLGVAVGEAQARIEAEAAALALLQHPAIAHVYRVGVYERHPYLVMERIDGARPLTTYAREEARTRRQRLALLADVVDGVHHGHQRGILHNDLKPQNVLVDASGFPKIIDFGIADVVDRSAGESHRRPAGGTLPYMSPEALGAGGEIDVRSDVYALGVIGYELLTGTLPLDPGARSVSEAVPWLREAAETPPAERPSPLKGDLAAIVNRALAPDPAQRYPSASALAADIRRYLARRPVEARGGGLAYQLGRFAARHKAAFATSLLLLLVTLAAAFVGTTMAIEKEREREAAARERDRAEFQSYVASVAAAAAALRVNDVGEARLRLEQAPPAHRNWEWHHLQGRLDTSERTLRAAGSQEHGSLSRDGRVVAAGTHRLTIWDFETGAIRLQVPLARELGARLSMALRAPKDRLVVGHTSGRVVVIDVASGESLRSIEAHDGRVWAVAWHPDGDRFATAGYDNTLKLWSLDGGGLLATFSTSSPLHAIAWSPEGDRLAGGTRDGRIHVFDPAEGTETSSWSAHDKNVEGLAFSPDGRLLASGCIDRTVALFDTSTGTARWRRKGHTGGVKGVAFAPDGRTIASVSIDRTVRLWDAETGQETACLTGHTNFVRSVAFTPDGRVVSFSRDGTVKVWATRRTHGVPVLAGHGATVSRLAFGPHGKTLYSCADDGVLGVFDIASRTLLRTHAGAKNGARAPLFAMRGDRVFTWSPSLQLCAWSLDGTRRERFPLRRSGMDAAIDADGGHAFHGIDSLRVVDLAAGKQVAAWPAHEGPIKRIGLSPDGRILASSDGQDVRLWDRHRSTRIAVLDAPAWYGATFAYRGDSRRLAMGVGDRLLLCDPSDGTILQTLLGPAGRIRDLAWSPDGSRLAAASNDGTVRLFDPERGAQVLVLHGHPEYATAIAWSPDGRTLASGGGNSGPEACRIRLWELPASTP